MEELKKFFEQSQADGFAAADPQQQTELAVGYAAELKAANTGVNWGVLIPLIIKGLDLFSGVFPGAAKFKAFLEVLLPFLS